MQFVHIDISITVIIFSFLWPVMYLFEIAFKILITEKFSFCFGRSPTHFPVSWATSTLSETFSSYIVYHDWWLYIHVYLKLLAGGPSSSLWWYNSFSINIFLDIRLSFSLHRQQFCYIIEGTIEPPNF
jgi:hypothetical protein